MSQEVFFGLAALTSAALLLTLAWAWRIRRFLARAGRAAGTILRVEREEHTTQSYGGDHPEQTSQWFTPVVAFAAEDGSKVEFRSRVSHPGKPLYREGEAVTVVYDRARPSTTAEIEGAAVWQPVVFSTLATLALLLVTAASKACA
ncbi:MAG TPA: DUF3592 domain-containing protein [Vicinamibacteria bacterium]|nr:DUF3592 domain-containing protein [Vicinamibacteria bacterium]